MTALGLGCAKTCGDSLEEENDSIPVQLSFVVVKAPT
jgi:hypothetical protein